MPEGTLVAEGDAHSLASENSLRSGQHTLGRCVSFDGASSLNVLKDDALERSEGNSWMHGSELDLTTQLDEHDFEKHTTSLCSHPPQRAWRLARFHRGHSWSILA